jgi:two-component system sensor histidine kinase DesK
VTEAVTNVVRHARATWCRVTLETAPGLLRLTVEDDGVGLGTAGDPGPAPLPATGNGMHTMRERAEEMRGVLRVRSEGGTRVTAELPVSTVARVVAS